MATYENLNTCAKVWQYTPWLFWEKSPIWKWNSDGDVRVSRTLDRGIFPISKPPTKSMKMFSQGWLSTGKGLYRPYFMLLGLLVQQIMHSLMNLATCSCVLS